MKPVDVKPSACSDFCKNNNDKDPKFKVRDNSMLQNQKVIFEMGQKKCL